MQNEIGRLRRKFRQDRAALFSPAALTLPCRDLLARHSALIDSIVSEIYRSSCRFAELETKRTRRSGLAIVATGGYGRHELNPFSDIDIAFLPAEEEDPWIEAAVHAAFKLVMDVFLSFREVRVGYAYRPLADIATWDLATLTALLDARHVCGDEFLAETLAAQLRRRLSPLDLVLEFQSEQAKWEKDPSICLYSVEPNLKSGPGSLRDLHRARWIYKLLMPGEESAFLPALRRLGFMPAGRIAQIEAASEWFWQARNWLHLAAGKHSDVLINNYQDRIAQQTGVSSAQEWLSKHYAHAETLALFRESAVRNAFQGPLDLGGVRLEHGRLHIQGKGKKHVPGNEVKALQLSQRYALPISPDDMERLEDSRTEAAQVTHPGPEEAWAFLQILNSRRRISSTLRTLARVGLMERFVSDFCRLMRYVPPDPAHSYTVGEHSLKIIEHLEKLRFCEDGSLSRFGELIGQCAHFDMLCLAALLHDSGKAKPGADHSEAAMDLTRDVATLLELPDEKREILEVLVRHHLVLVRTARLQDLKSSAVIQNVAEKVQSVDALRHLYIFTYADTRAVAEKNWTSIDDRDLQELYNKVKNVISGRAAEEANSNAVENRIGEIRRKLAVTAPEYEEAIQRHCDSMPSSYVLNTPLDEIAFHIRLMERLESEGVVLDIYNRPGDDYSELTICTYDDPRPGMLAKITGVLYGCNTDIYKAQAFTMEKGRPVVLDTLWIRSGGLQLSETRAGRVRSSLRDVLTGAKTIEQFLNAAGKRPPNGILLDSVDLRNDLSEEHTVVHVIARDLQGLLYLMTRALSRCGLHIHSAKVATWNARAENNFYVTSLTGGQIPDSDLSHWKSQLGGVFRGVTSE